MALAFGRVRVAGPSMVPLLSSGQRLLAGRLPLLLGRPKRGDIVLVAHPRRPGVVLVKRVVGCPGDTVRTEGGRICVNGKPVAPPATAAAADRALRLGPSEFFVAGTAGEGSASFGPVPRAAILAKAWLSVWPPERWGFPSRTLGRGEDHKPAPDADARAR